MDTIEVTLVGGPHDGKRLTLANHVKFLDFAKAVNGGFGYVRYMRLDDFPWIYQCTDGTSDNE